ncbi:MAG TPA: EAL domain-containing protein [Eoetvoesiella sp.]
MLIRDKANIGLHGHLEGFLRMGRLFGWPCRKGTLSFFFLIFSLVYGCQSTAQALEQISLQLKWHHQFQFAGYYAAQAKGFYKDEGLSVSLIEGGVNQAPISAVVSQRAQYGVGDADILLARLEGAPLVALAAIFQHSPYILLSRRDRGIRNVFDLIGKRVMLSNDQGLEQFRAMLINEGIDPATVNVIPHSWNLDDLIDGNVDAISAYLTAEPGQLLARGVEPAILNSATYGVDFYGDTLFTTQAEIERHPARVNEFLRASKKGWAYALAHPQEIVDLILKMDGVAQRGLTREMLLQEARDMQPLILPNLVEIGHINEGRWEHIAQTLVKTGLAPVNFSLSGFVYHPDPPLNPETVRWAVGLSVAAALLIALILLWNMQMRRRVRDRTQELQAEIRYRAEAQNKLKQSRTLLKIAGGAARVGGWVIEVANDHVIWSDEVYAIHDMSPGVPPSLEAALGFVQPEYRYKVEELIFSCLKDGVPFDEEFTIITARGRSVSVRMIGQPVRDENEAITQIHGAIQDISRRKEYENNIRRLALYDHLTDLPNRKLLVDRLTATLEASVRTRRYGAVLFIDLDNFKSLNDTLGHDLGDQLLQQAATRLVRCVRKEDTVARLGGDEFVVVLDSLGDSAREAEVQVRMVAEKMLAVFQHSFQLDGYEQYSTPSIGIALYQGQSKTVETLLKHADLAMYQAKASGRNTIRFFDPEMEARVLARRLLEASLLNGLQRQEFELHYQPQVGGNGKISGVEALVRWRHPEKGLVLPGAFIPIAEETGLIVPLGQWVLETACKQLVKWSGNPVMSHLVVAVNVSAREFRHPRYLDETVKVLFNTGVDPHKLKLEITESVLLDNQEDMITKMHLLKLRGVGFALDDFGTGYSSLSYLKRLPLDQLKIDQSFVHDLTTDPNEAVIARTIVGLGKSLGLDVIAEGVETEEQREFLARYGCYAYQGHLFSGALRVERLEAFVLAEYGAASLVARFK